MSKTNSGNNNNKNFDEESSDDSITGMENPEEPLFYMFPESGDEEDEKYFKKNLKNVSRKSILSKIDLLTKFHKKSENKQAHSKIGWHTVYELFFEKLFFIDKEIKEKGAFINLKEIEVRIRRELGHMSQIKKGETQKNSSFSLFEKLQYNPPVSAWYSTNFISNDLNKLIAPKEKNSFVCKVINEYVNFEDKNNEKKYDNKNSNNNDTNYTDKLIKKIDKLKTEHDLIDDSFYEEMDGDKDLIPKGAKKVVDKFLKKHNITNIEYVEDEMNNIQSNEKAYDIELRNTKLFESKFLDENKFLIDFNYLKHAMQKEKKDDNVENKKELEQLFSQINKTIDLIKETSNMN